METFNTFHILTIVLLFLLFVVGEILLICGYKKYNYSLAWILLPLVGVIFCFPAYSGLKENFYKKSGDEAMANIAHRQLIAGICFVAAMILWAVISGVIAILPGLNSGNINAMNWIRLLCFGMYSICLIYLIVVLLLRKK